MAAVRFNIFEFASVGVCADVENAISRCGYDALSFPGSSFYDSDPFGSDPPPVLLIESGWNGVPKIHEVLHRRPAHTWIGIFVGDWLDLALKCLDFVLWPTRLEELKLRLDRQAAQVGANKDLTPDRLAGIFAQFNVVSESASFLRVLGRAEKIARTTATTLIEGETGTGKELIARAIHYMSARRSHPFIAVNCGAIPEGLVGSEFFGHERGAFTDACDHRVGVVEQASGGTLFLDEVEALCAKGQVALLRLLQENEFRRVGSSVARSVDARVIAASNQPLATLVSQGSFRSDLYYRLNILSMIIPPLRQRPEDIEPLARRFLASLCSRYRAVKSLTPQSLEWMKRWNWPGNVRELENLLHRAYVFSDGATLDLEPPDGGVEPACDGSFQHDFQTEKSHTVNQFERAYLSWAMHISHGNITKAAQLAGKERRAMGKLLKKHAIGRK